MVDNFYLEEAKFETNQRILDPRDANYYQVMRSDFNAPKSSTLNIIKTRDRVKVKTYIP